MNLDSELRRALRRKSPPEGFASRVAHRLQHEPRNVSPSIHAHRGWRAVAAGLLLTAIAGSWAAGRVAERRQGERAKQDVLLALRIAGSKVREAQRHVRDIGSR